MFNLKGEGLVPCDSYHRLPSVYPLLCRELPESKVNRNAAPILIISMILGGVK